MSTAAYRVPSAPRRVWNAYRGEIYKARRRKFTYLGPILVTLAVIGTAAARISMESESNPYEFLAFATPMALNLLGLLVLLMYCGTLMATELGNGSVRAVITRPVRRHELIFAKILLAMTYAALLTVCTVGTALIATRWMAPMDGIELAGEPIYSAGEMAAAYALGCLAVLVPQFAAGAYAILISTLTRSAGAAVGSVVGLWFLLDFLKIVLGVERYVFSTYYETPWRVFVGRCNGLNHKWFPELGYCLASSTLYFVLFTALAIFIFVRKDLRA